MRGLKRDFERVSQQNMIKIEEQQLSIILLYYSLNGASKIPTVSHSSDKSLSTVQCGHVAPSATWIRVEQNCIELFKSICA